MCGIGGLFCEDPEKLQQLIDKMGDRLVHRGPDENGLLIDRQIALVHTRLSIIDLQTGQQPLYSCSKRYALIANGEIYNHVELREELTRSGCRFATASDCETIVHTFARYGHRGFERLRGMFAAAILDKQSQRLTLVRDRLGIKPLFYLARPGLFAFASEIKALLPLLEAEPRFNPPSLRMAMDSNFSSGIQTPIEGVQRLLPGEWIDVDYSGVKTRKRYWLPEPAANVPADFSGAVKALDTLMVEAVKEHLRSDVPVGIFLSGGLDSSSLLSVMRQTSDAPIDAYTVGFDTGDDETLTAATTANALGATHHALRLSHKDLIDWLPLAVWAADELMFDYANLPTLRLAAEAAKQLKVVICGEGGDEVFAGYGRYRHSQLQRVLGQLSGTKRGFRRRGNFHPYFAREVFKPVLRDLQWDACFEQIAASIGSNLSSPSLCAMQQIDMRSWLVDDLLVKSDRMLMAFGLEGRLPYLDHRVVEFGLSLPDNFKISNRRGKLLQRSWCESRLPAEIVRAPKQGFTVPIGPWLASESMKWLTHALQNNRIIREWFLIDGVRDLFNFLHRGGRDGQHAASAIWALMQIALWYEIFVIRQGRRPDPQEPLQGWLS